MKERSGADSNVEFQSGTTKKSTPVAKPKPKKPSVAELKKLTKNQLIELAEKKNLKVKKSGAKAAVISEIRDQL